MKWIKDPQRCGRNQRVAHALMSINNPKAANKLIESGMYFDYGVHLSEGRGQKNQQPTPNDNKSEWWSSSVVLVYDLHRGMCCKPSGKVQEGREGLLMGNICDW